MKLKFIPLFLIFLFPLSALKQDPFQTVRAMLRSGEDSKNILSVLEVIGQTEFEYDGSYELFLAEYNRLLGKIHRVAKNKESAKSALRESIKYAKKINDQAESARALFYLSSSGFLLAELEGLRSIISESEKLGDYTDRALEMTPYDPEIILQKASSLAYPPKLFGGDPKKAITLLEKGLELNELYDYIRFDLLDTLSYCYQRQGENDKALELAENALQLYSENEELLKRINDLKKKV